MKGRVILKVDRLEREVSRKPYGLILRSRSFDKSIPENVRTRADFTRVMAAVRGHICLRLQY